MSERLVVDSFMTADGEVVQLPTLGPLGPVDAEIRIFENEISGEFFAFNGSILVGPCESAERAARECNCFIRMREVNSYNARKSGGSDGE